MKKLLKKKNNKGFSLVELIVVVLIMAILAVALAPQVMKWVGHSRTSADVTAYQSVYSAAQLALADEAVYTAVTGLADDVEVTITINGTNTTLSANAPAALGTKLAEILGSDYTSSIKAKVSGESYVITLNNKGSLAKTDAPDGSTVK